MNTNAILTKEKFTKSLQVFRSFGVSKESDFRNETWPRRFLSLNSILYGHVNLYIEPILTKPLLGFERIHQYLRTTLITVISFNCEII